MTRSVQLTVEAIRDMAEIHAFLAAREGKERADAVVDGLERTVRSLGSSAGRGHTLPELAEMGLNTILEIHFKPWRIVYHLEPKTATVLVVADGRRVFSALLARRHLR